MLRQKNYIAQITGTGSLINESKKILRLAFEGKTQEQIRQMVIDQNILDKSTIGTRKRIFGGIKYRYFNDYTEEQSYCIQKIIASSLPEKVKNFILYYHMNLADYTLYGITTKCLYGRYLQGFTGIVKDTLLDFLEKEAKQHPEIHTLSEQTKSKVIVTYLAILKDFGILEGVKNKTFTKLYIPLEVILYVIYSLLDEKFSDKKIIYSDDFKLFLLEPSNIIRYLEEGTKEGVLKFKNAGEIFDLFLPYKTLKEYVDALK